MSEESNITMSNEYEFEIGFFESLLKREPKDTDVVEILGGLYTKTGRIDDGLKMDRKLVRLMPKNPTAYYNLGCSLALKKRKSEAIEALRTAVKYGYSDANWMKDDPDLETLRKHPEFEKILMSIQ